MVFFFFEHCMACFFYGVSYSIRLSYPVTRYSKGKYQDMSFSERYINSLFQIITLAATGIGDKNMTPNTTEERIVAIINMCLSGTFYAYLINNVARIVNNYNILATQYK